LLLAYPALKTESGPVLDRLNAAGADHAAIQEWRRLVDSEIRAADPDEDI